MNFARAAEIVGLKGGEFPNDIKKKYKKFVLKYHPDRYQSESAKKQAEKRLKEINEVYQYIMDNADECFDRTAKKKQTKNPLKFDDEFYERNRNIEWILRQTEEIKRNRQNQTYDNVCEEKYSFDKKYDKYTVNYDDCYDTLDGYQDDYDNDADYDYEEYEDYYDDEMPETRYEKTVIRKSTKEKIFEILGTIILGIFYLFLRAINNELDKE